MGLPKAISFLCAATLTAVPWLRPGSGGNAPLDSRFSRAMTPGDSPSEPIHPCLRFDWAGDFSEGLAPVEVEGRFGFIDTLGTIRIPTGYEFAGEFSCNRGPALQGGKWGYLDVTGRMIVPAAYDWAGPFREGLAVVAIDSQYAVIDTNGDFAGPLRFSDAHGYSGGYAAVRIGEDENAAWGFVDRQGRLAIPPLFNDVPEGFSEGLAVVRMENERPYRSGYIDSSGGFAIDTLYDAAGPFHEGLAPVGRGDWRGNRFHGAWGYVDTTGRLVTSLTFAEAGAFQDGKALVRLLSGGGNALIDRRGRVLKSFRADAELGTGPAGSMVPYKLHDLYGLVDPGNGRCVTAAYAEAGSLNQGWARVKLTGGVRGAWAFVAGDGRFLGGVANVAAH